MRPVYAMLVSYARLFMKDDWAEDVVQDVFYNVWQNRAALDDSNSLYKYLLRRSTTARSTIWTRTGAPAITAPTIRSGSPRWAAPTMRPTTVRSSVSSIPTTCARVSTRRSSRCRPNAARYSD
ncbi:MAG: sigma factor [Alistipes sp.]